MFETMTKEQYRSLDFDALEERKAAILAELENKESEIDLAELRSEVELIKEEVELRKQEIKLRNAKIEELKQGAGEQVERSAEKEEKMANVDRFDTEEYRNAFMAYIQRGTEIPMELRGTDAYTLTTDVAPQIPTTMGIEIVKKMEEYGTIWNKVRKLSVKGGLWFRTVDLNPTASWITESQVSNYQKATDDDKISFSFYMLECRIAMSLLASAVTYDDFKALFVEAVAKAMVVALEAAVVAGDGDGKPLGITEDPRVTNVVEMTAADLADWKAWHKKVKAAMPKMYRNGEFIMAQASWDSYIETLADDNDRPISATTYNAVTGEEEYRLMGKRVETVEGVIKDFDTAIAGDVIAIFGDLNNYVVNTQPGMPMTTTRWIDHEANMEKAKALVAVDGKVLDPYGFILVKKKASA